MSNNTFAHFSNIPVISLPKASFAFSAFPLLQFLKLPENDIFAIPDTILGKQAEAIFEEIIIQSSTLELLVANLQINEGKQTIGELDYLVKDKATNAVYHIELACKFYLFDNANSAIYEAKWIGSNRKDTLYDKLEKLANKQFPLLHHPATQPLLKKLDIDVKKVIQYQYITSSFFIPKNKPIKDLPEAYQSCVMGYWQHYKDVALDENSVYAIPSKREWLLPASNIKKWMTASQTTVILADYMKQRRAPMIYQKTETEIIKFFVVWWDLPESF